jgi:hypothetical protein
LSTLLEKNNKKIRMACMIGDNSISRPIWFDDFVRNKASYYKSFYIPKKELRKQISAGYKPEYSSTRIPESKKHLWRKISAPVQCLLEAQRQIMFSLYKRRPSKYDYCVIGKNRYDAMRQVAGYKVIIASDIKDAFPSTSSSKIIQTLRLEGFSGYEINTITELSTLDGVLPQGSPCSPVILNLCRKRLDHRLDGYVKKMYGGSIAVYVDNYYMGSNNPSFNKCISILKSIADSSGYEFPDKKIHVMRSGGRQHGLGLVTSKINDKIIVQPDKRYRKRLQAMLHNGLKRKKLGLDPWDDIKYPQIRGMVECFHGSIYYNRFRHMAEMISGKVTDRISGLECDSVLVDDIHNLPISQ